MARSGHWDVVGVEPNERAASYARQTVECTVLQSTFADADLEEASFEAIVLWCVVEHLAHPIEDLRRAYTLLKPSGWLVFSVPNYESFGARIFGKFWSGWDLPRHLYVFPRTIMNDILVSTGFHNISAHCISTSYQALGHSLDFWFQNWADQYPKLERALRQVYYSWIMRLGLFIPLAVLERFNLTTNITYFAQKS
jgi:SAM-dependent methyltransferase